MPVPSLSIPVTLGKLLHPLNFGILIHTNDYNYGSGLL